MPYPAKECPGRSRPSGKLTEMSGELEKGKSLTVGADFQLP